MCGDMPSIVVAHADDEMDGEEWDFQTRRATWSAHFAWELDDIGIAIESAADSKSEFDL
jgi:hypothetical protein